MFSKLVRTAAGSGSWALAAAGGSCSAAARAAPACPSLYRTGGKDVDSRCSSTSPAVDPKQAQLLDEQLLLVDEQDRCVGTSSKRDCHSWQGGSCPLHRAFSVFLFDSRQRLLLQQRSSAKITFPGHYTNTCCSHPLAVADESETEGGVGVIRAAQRRLFLELGIPPEQVPQSKFSYLTRILYKAASHSDGGHEAQWGEHEVDYILVVRGVDPSLAPDPNEVRAVQFVSERELTGLVSKLTLDAVPLTPWFRLIIESGLLHQWWNSLHCLHPFVDHRTIHRL